MSAIALPTVKPLLRVKKDVYKHAPYWESEQTLNPVLVRFLETEGDFVKIRFPNGGEEWVHCHKLGVFR